MVRALAIFAVLVGAGLAYEEYTSKSVGVKSSFKVFGNSVEHLGSVVTRATRSLGI